MWTVGGPVGARGEPGRGEGKDESWGRQCHLESRPESAGKQDELIREAGKCDGGLALGLGGEMILSFVGAEAGQTKDE